MVQNVVTLLLVLGGLLGGGAGILEAQQADSVTSTLDSGVVLQGALETAPEVVRHGRIIYPLDLLRNGKQGRVIVQFILDTTGRAEPQSLQVVSTPHMGFNVVAKGYVRDLRYTPVVFQGRKVRVLMQVPVDFRIGSGPR